MIRQRPVDFLDSGAGRGGGQDNRHAPVVVAFEQGEAPARGQPLRGFEISVAGEDVFG